MSVRGPLPYSLRQLQYLVAVAELGGFRSAADACGVAQPSLSAQIALVEAAIGVQIFERGRRGARVTPAGARVVERARAALVAATDVADTARRHSDPLSGRVRVGIIPTVCPYLLPDAAPALRKQLPGLQVVWSEDKTARLLDQVESATLDGAILALDDRLAPFDYAPIGDDPFVLAVPPGHRLASRRGPASPEMLSGETVFLLEDGHCFRDQALALCGGIGAAEADVTATGLATLVQMVAAGDGVTLLPSMAVAVENRRSQLAIRRFKEPAPTRSLVIAWRRGSAMARPLGEVARIVRKARAGRGSPTRR